MCDLSMKKLFIIFLLAISACGVQGEAKIVIVDKDGKPAKISKFTPEFNEKQLGKQKETQKVSSQVRMVNVSTDDLDHIKTIEKETFVSSNQNIPDYLLADRVVNYAKVDNQDNLMVRQQNIENAVIKTTSTKSPAKFKINETATTVKTSNKPSVKYILNTTAPAVKEKTTKTITKNAIGVVETKKINNPTTVTPKNNVSVIETKKENVPSNSVTVVEVKKNNTPMPIVNIIKTNESSGVKAKELPELSDKPEPGKSFYIQLGVFSEKVNADEAYGRYSKIDKCIMKDYLSKGKKSYRLLMGPYSSRAIADKFLDKVISSGHYDTYVTQE